MLLLILLGLSTCVSDLWWTMHSRRNMHVKLILFTNANVNVIVPPIFTSLQKSVWETVSARISVEGLVFVESSEIFHSVIGTVLQWRKTSCYCRWDIQPSWYAFSHRECIALHTRPLNNCLPLPIERDWVPMFLRFKAYNFEKSTIYDKFLIFVFIICWPVCPKNCVFKSYQIIKGIIIIQHFKTNCIPAGSTPRCMTTSIRDCADLECQEILSVRCRAPLPRWVLHWSI